MENPYWHEYTKPHAVDFSEVRELCFQSFAICAASHSLKGVPGEEVGGPLHDLFFHRAEEALSKNLLRLAVVIRTFDDLIRGLEFQAEYDALLENKINDGRLGSFAYKEAEGDRADISLREACNKIIHAYDIRPVYDNGSHSRDEDYAWGMEGTIELEGRLRDKTWDVWLFADEFLSACIEIANKFEPAPPR